MSPFGMQSFMRHAPSQCLTAYVTSHIPCGMRSFMRHVLAQCLTPYVMSHIPFGMRSFIRHAPSQCLALNVNVPYSMYVELYASWSSGSMSDTVCMSYHIPWEVRSFMHLHHHNFYIVYACHVIFHVIIGFMRYAASILSYSESIASFYALCTISMSNSVFNSHFRSGVWNFVSHAPSECLTPYVMSHSMSNLKLHASCTISMYNRMSWLIPVECYMRRAPS